MTSTTLNKALFCLFLVLLCILCTACFILTTTTGLRMAVTAAGALQPGIIAISRVEGRIIDSFRIYGLRIHLSDLNLSASSLECTWRARDILQRKIHFNSIAIKDLEVVKADSNKAPAARTTARPGTMSLPFGLAIDDLHIERACFISGPSRHELERLELRAQAKNNLLDMETLKVVFPGGMARLSGRVTMTGGYPFSANMSGFATTGRGIPVEVEADAAGDLSQLSIEAVLRQPVEARAGIVVSRPLENLGWQASVELIGADTGTLVPDIPRMHLSGQITASGNLARYKASARLFAEGKLPVKEVRALINGTRHALRIQQLKAVLLKGEVSARAKAAWENGITWHLDLSGRDISPRQFHKKAPEGELNFCAVADGERNSEGIHGQIQLSRLEGRLSCTPLAGRARIAFSPDKINVSGLVLDALETHLEAGGSIKPRLDLTLSARIKDLSEWNIPLRGPLKVTGTAGGSLNAPVLTLDVRSPELAFGKGLAENVEAVFEADLNKKGKLNLRLGAEKMSFPNVQLGNLDMNIKGTKARQQVNFSMTCQGRPLEASIKGKYEAGKWQGTIMAVEADTRLFGPWSLDGPSEIELSPREIKLGQMCMKRKDENSSLCAAGIFYPPQADWEVKAEIHRLPSRLLNAFATDDLVLAGYIDMNVLAKGVGGTIQKGRFFMKGIDAEVVPLNISLKNAEARGTIEHNRARFTLRVTSGIGHIKTAGDIDLSIPFEGPATLRITGRNFLAANLPELVMIASPEVKATLDGKDILLAGRMIIPEAEIDLEGISRPEYLSEDVIIVDESQPCQEAHGTLSTGADLTIELGDKVSIKGYGIQGRVAGELRIHSRPGLVTTAAGELALKDATFSMYGQKLIIKRGRLIFANTPIDNPGLDLTAIREIKTRGVTVGLKASGTIKKPELKLFSTPQMDQASILSYLVIGRPLTLASKEQGGKLIKAAQMLALKQGASIMETISNRFGFLDIQLEEKKGNNLAIVVGLYLSPRLYVSYGRSLFKSASTYKLRYYLGRGWRIETTVEGENSGADLLYSP